MKVYLDLILLLNFVIDFLILLTVSIILRRNAKIKRILFASFIGTISILVLFVELSSILLFVFKLLLACTLILISFGFVDIKYFLNNLLYFYTNSILLGGFLYYINIELSYKNIGLVFIDNNIKLNFFVVVIFSPIILYIYSRQLKKLKMFYSNRKKVQVYLDNNEVIELSGYVDSGNTLIEPYGGKYVILAHNNELIQYSKLNNYILVPYKALNYEGIIKCIIPKNVYIDGIGLKQNVVVGISENKIKMDGIDCLLNILMEDKWKNYLKSLRIYLKKKFIM